MPATRRARAAAAEREVKRRAAHAVSVERTRLVGKLDVGVLSVIARAGRARRPRRAPRRPTAPKKTSGRTRATACPSSTTGPRRRATPAWAGGPSPSHPPRHRRPYPRLLKCTLIHMPARAGQTATEISATPRATHTPLEARARVRLQTHRHRLVAHLRGGRRPAGRRVRAPRRGARRRRREPGGYYGDACAEYLIYVMFKM